jgi:hypothetical protein
MWALIIAEKMLRESQKPKTNAATDHRRFDRSSALAIKIFVGLLYSSAAILTIVVAISFTFGVWESLDQNLATRLPSLN